MVQFELRRWALGETVIVPTSERVAFLAADLAKIHKLQAFDALIYATALEHDAQLVTCDAYFKDLPQVDYSAKSK